VMFFLLIQLMPNHHILINTHFLDEFIDFFHEYAFPDISWDRWSVVGQVKISQYIGTDSSLLLQPQAVDDLTLVKID
jgi:hypothetical protein